MANTFNISVTAQLSTPGGVVPISFGFSVDQTGTAFERRVLSVQSEADGWSQFTKPTEMGDVYCIIVYNSSENSNAVNYALSAANTNQPAEIPAGCGVVLFKPDASELFFSHLGGTGTTQDVEIFTLET